MAAGATNRQTQKGLAGGADDLVDRIGPNLRSLRCVRVADGDQWSTDEKCESHFNVGITRPQSITRQMLHHEAIERFVFVERPDDIVAERPRVVDHIIYFKARAFTETSYIQPVTAPLLTISR